MNQQPKQFNRLERAIEDWYRWESPANPQQRAEAVAEYWGVSPTLLHKATQADFAKRQESY